MCNNYFVRVLYRAIGIYAVKIQKKRILFLFTCYLGFPIWLVIALVNFLVGSFFNIISFLQIEKFDYNLIITAIVKNEGAYIREWIEYHKICGVSKIVLYDNESTDGLQGIISDYILTGYVDYIFCPGRGKQLDAYNDAIKKYRNKSKYIAFIDADEFIVSKTGELIPNLVERLMKKQAGGLAVNWKMFGSSNFESRPCGLVIENFLYRAKDDFQSNWCIKTIANPRKILRFEHVHVPSYIPGIYNIDENGNKVFGPYNVAMVPRELQINHYFTKSKEEWVARRSLGKADFKSDKEKRTMDEFYEHDKNDIYDPYMLGYVESVKKGILYGAAE